ncbi:DUF721 domain-containing protein [Streptomyces sp. NPDC048663]|uniref:DUF721 domain-containing protein n=1 Tax=Streptomyces sp. NPDC048663 TaxID=3155638 RepID=UPI003414AF2B
MTTETPQLSGVDLARVALRAAKAAAQKNGSGRTAKPKTRTTSVVRRGGREPMGLGAAIGALVTERAWELPAAGAKLRVRWAAIAPKLAGHVAAVSYDADSGQLMVCPESAAWATKTRLEQTRIIAAANECGPHRCACLANPGPRRSGCARAGRRRPGARGWARRAAEHEGDRLGRLPSRVDSSISEAVERQTKAMWELSRRAFPEPDNDSPVQLDPGLSERRRQAEASRAAALRRARAERAQRASDPEAVPRPQQGRSGEAA